MKDIKLMFMDVDGTLTDGKIYMSNGGEIFKAFSIKDGYAIAHMLPKARIEPVIITARESAIVTKRAIELGITHIYQGCKDKKLKMINVCSQFGLFANNNGVIPQTSYIGDDLMDIECMKVAQYRGCPIDAVTEIKDISDFISSSKGGDGSVREFIEWIIYS